MIVIGAGLSGITTALLLEERGIDVTVVEARDRVGGRVWTMDDVPGKPDAGGPVLGASYERLLKIAKALSAPIQPMKSFETSELVYVNGQNVIAADWASSAANKLQGAERQSCPASWWGTTRVRTLRSRTDMPGPRRSTRTSTCRSTRSSAGRARRPRPCA